MKMRQKTREIWLIVIFGLATCLSWYSKEAEELIVTWACVGIMWLAIATIIFSKVVEKRKLDQERPKEQ